MSKLGFFAQSNFPPALKELRIRDCDSLQYLFDESMDSNTCLLEHLEVRGCSSLIWLSSRADICNRLQHLRIYGCPKLSSLFLNSKLPVMLKRLSISGCWVLECVAQDLHETTDLEIIQIREVQSIKSLPSGLDKLRHLQEISLRDCSNLVACFKEIGLPSTNLRVVKIMNCENFGALPKCINSFTSLRELRVSHISFPEEGFPTGLATLEISGAPEVYSSLVEWGFYRLTYLQVLRISGEGCSNVVSFPEESRGMTLPPSLRSIRISNFKNLEFMCSKGFQHLTCLEELGICNCPKLTSLLGKDVLLSLGCLSIDRCPLLKEECTRFKGREWSKISHIPRVVIDGYLKLQWELSIIKVLD
ncbi:probable disease resistance protein RPP1 [Hibiscus syriacus]|uniref:probable disease resistance protein RPP1 n=1 Tax=Hibiscus syriacus TaxID=106335 RepID=UPI001921EC7F|nr:probable disease resistance protein RPP1 [Hibiscus syriacus]